MTSDEIFSVERVVRKHINAMIKELSASSEVGGNLGHWPYDDTAAYVDVVMAILKHQSLIDEYHVREKTNFE